MHTPYERDSSSQNDNLTSCYLFVVEVYIIIKCTWIKNVYTAVFLYLLKQKKLLVIEVKCDSSHMVVNGRFGGYFKI